MRGNSINPKRSKNLSNKVEDQLGFFDHNLIGMLLNYAQNELSEIQAEGEKNRWFTQFIGQPLEDKLKVLSDKDKSDLVAIFKRERRDGYVRMFGFLAGAVLLGLVTGAVFSSVDVADSADTMTALGRIIVPMVLVGFSIAMLVGSGYALNDLIFCSKKKKAYQSLGIFSEAKAPSVQLVDTLKQISQQ